MGRDGAARAPSTPRPSPPARGPAIAELAPHLIGADPCQPLRLVRRMDAVMRGQPYVKSALDMACWDAAARRPRAAAVRGAGRPLRRRRSTLYRSLPPASPAPRPSAPGGHVARRLPAAAGQGRRRPGASTPSGWRPCATRPAPRSSCSPTPTAPGRPPTRAASCIATAGLALHARAAVRARSRSAGRCGRTARTRWCWTSRSTSLAALLRAWPRRPMPTASRSRSPALGGVTRAAALRDVAVELGLTVTVEDTGGATIDTAAMLHLSLSTPEPHRAAHRRLQPTGSRSRTPTGCRSAARRPDGRAGRARPGRHGAEPSRSASRSTAARVTEFLAPARRDRWCYARGRGRRGDARPARASWPTPPASGSPGPRDVTDDLLARGERVYGLTTGVGRAEAGLGGRATSSLRSTA